MLRVRGSVDIPIMSKLRFFSILVCSLLLLAGTDLSASIFHSHPKQPSYKVSHKNRSATHFYGSNKKNHYKAPKYHAPKYQAPKPHASQ